MSLPTGVDYLKAIQSPATALSEPVLRSCKVDCNPMGLPSSWSGSNAIVFRLRAPDGPPFALRCFTQKIQDVESRYQAYSDFYKAAPKDLKNALASTRYVTRGIPIPDGNNDPWKPAIIMAWVDGKHLGKWVETHHSNPAQLTWLQGKLRGLARLMAKSGFIHGDLQHRNIMVGEKGPVLVDYDSVILPGSKGLRLTTQGLAAFRHPLAGADTPPGALDRFAFLVLHVGLEALIRQPKLFDQWGQVEGLLFQGVDFRNPGASPLFKALLAHPELRGLAETLGRVCLEPAAKTPDLDGFLEVAGKFQNMPPPTVLPPWGSQQLTKLAALYASNPEPAPKPKPKSKQVRVHRIEVDGPFTSAAKHPVAQATPLVATGVALISALDPVQAPPRWKARRILGGLALAGTLMLACQLVHPFTGNAAPATTALIRKELQLKLEAKKDLLLPLIVGMDEELETLRALPDDLRLARLDPASGVAEAYSAARLRQNLAQTREQARQALIRCDGMMEDFDAALLVSGLTPAQQAQRLASIQDLPPDILSRIRHDLPRGAQP